MSPLGLIGNVQYLILRPGKYLNEMPMSDWSEIRVMIPKTLLCYKGDVSINPTDNTNSVALL